MKPEIFKSIFDDIIEAASEVDPDKSTSLSDLEYDKEELAEARQQYAEAVALMRGAPGMLRALMDFESNYDHDTGAHGIHIPEYCRCCIARSAIAKVNPS